MFTPRLPARAARLCTVLAVAAASLAEAADPESGNAARGRALVASNCANCHGVQGVPTLKSYPVLSGQRPDYIAVQLTSFKNHSREDLTMSDVSAHLAAADIRDVAAYLGALPVPANQTASTPAPIGERLFSRGDPGAGIPACQSCHGSRGEGLAVAGIPRVAGQPELYVWAELEAFKASERGKEPGNPMSVIAARLGTQDMKEVARYIATLH